MIILLIIIKENLPQNKEVNKHNDQMTVVQTVTLIKP